MDDFDGEAGGIVGGQGGGNARFVADEDYRVGEFARGHNGPGDIWPRMFITTHCIDYDFHGCLFVREISGDFNTIPGPIGNSVGDQWPGNACVWS